MGERREIDDWRLAGWDIGKDRERQWMKDFAQNLQGERERDRFKE